MSNQEYSRLAYLMDSFGVTGQELADLLHVDKTLISKWRNHRRQIPARSEYLKRIAEFFVATDAQTNSGTIKKILAGYDSNLDSQGDLTKFICQWLSEIEGPQELINPMTGAVGLPRFLYFPGACRMAKPWKRPLQTSTMPKKVG